MGSQNAQKTRKPAEKASHFGCGYASLSSKYLAIQIQENTGVYRYIHIYVRSCEHGLVETVPHSKAICHARN